MAQLIITRPKRWTGKFWGYRLLIDGEQKASIASGKTVQLDLPPGPHEIRAKVTWMKSPGVVIDGSSDQTYHLVVDFDWRVQRLGLAAFVITALPIYPFVIFSPFPASSQWLAICQILLVTVQSRPGTRFADSLLSVWTRLVS